MKTVKQIEEQLDILVPIASGVPSRRFAAYGKPKPSDRRRWKAQEIAHILTWVLHDDVTLAPSDFTR